MEEAKKKVHDFWNEASCGEALFLKDNTAEAYAEHANIRYVLEPCIPEFAQFPTHKGKKVLEIGLGVGADHQCWAEAGVDLYGVDLTERAVQHTTHRLKTFGLKSNLQTGDAENLPFEDNTFDLIYSWGVLHCSPDTTKAINEVHRVLKPGGQARIMIYHKYSFVGYMLWLRYGLLKLKPFTSLEEIYDKYLESPGTKAYSIEGGKKLFEKYSNVEIETILCHGDLLTSEAGQRHRGPLLVLARAIWPRWIIKTFFKGHGLFMMINAKK